MGKVDRISPEAPVPVVNIEKERFVLGGASNVANNLISLSASVSVYGVVGNDANGEKFIKELEDKKIDSVGIVKDGSRPTIIKSRVLAQGQQLLRLDWEKDIDISSENPDKILELLKEIQQKNGTSIIFITHDLGVVANVADRVAVMYAGKIVEYGLVDEIFYNPRHPYTWGLLCSMPSLEEEGSLYTIPGTPPDLLNPPKGDAFALRSDYALGIDFEEMPPMFAVSNTHAAATWLLDERAPKVELPEEIQKRWAQFESRRVTNE